MTGAEIAEILGIPLSTVSLWLKRLGLGKRSRLEPPEPPNRYERRHPGELVHVDIKKLGRISARGAGHRVLGHRGSQYARQVAGRKTRFTGFEYVHVMVDDHSRLAYAEVLDDLTASCALAFLRRAVAWFAERGVRVRAVMSDNGAAYVAHEYRRCLQQLGLRHLGSDHAGRKRTAKQSASSRRSSTNGRTHRSTRAPTNAQVRSHPSCGATTSHDHTAPLGRQAPATRLNNLVGNYT